MPRVYIANDLLEDMPDLPQFLRGQMAKFRRSTRKQGVNLANRFLIVIRGEHHDVEREDRIIETDLLIYPIHKGLFGPTLRLGCETIEAASLTAVTL